MRAMIHSFLSLFMKMYDTLSSHEHCERLSKGACIPKLTLRRFRKMGYSGYSISV